LADPLSLAGRVALITGASRGIGQACAVALAGAGAAVVLHAREAAHLDAVAAQVGALGQPEPLRLAYDVTDRDAMRRAFEILRKRHRQLDILVNNAGVLESGLLGMITDDSLQRVLATNLEAAIQHLQLAARLMAREKRGTIVNVSSIVGVRGAPGQVAYAASKAGIIGATLAAARELAPAGIRVNAIAPGFIDTDMNRGHKAETHAATLAKVAMGRMGTAAEVADVVLFLVSDLARYVTGQVLGVDGGMTL
jgi:3-oxoacyl-[acyl-carrier protein] reductase